ncbi:Uncharacterised protein [Salmonella enterica subsp. enterica serovar Bovismorbificans]|uniref:Uncharacterized protein n=1 Tax=Salmonella enterica subsp. enterica serovar Bovismorbificans TaxID=58097 RepID=A0A655BR60_SALET|nr:Uncharacterised protein [Salmonella enterica subsp. enterica serovar Bovismorbificans]CNT96687.1 Uncharacterised protein [Salmonella enterica subsp. enterica serovar Bovismorbificans]
MLRILTEKIIHPPGVRKIAQGELYRVIREVIVEFNFFHDRTLKGSPERVIIVQIAIADPQPLQRVVARFLDMRSQANLFGFGDNAFLFCRGVNLFDAQIAVIVPPDQ